MATDRYPAPPKPVPPPGSRWERLRPILLWSLTGFLGFLFLTVGTAKLAGNERVIDRFATWGYPRSLVTIVGVVETLGAAALFVPPVARLGAYALISVMAGAAVTHFRAGEWPNPLYNLLFAVALYWIARPGR